MKPAEKTVRPLTVKTLPFPSACHPQWSIVSSEIGCTLGME